VRVIRRNFVLFCVCVNPKARVMNVALISRGLRRALEV
jgi:hypothetical protein